MITRVLLRVLLTDAEMEPIKDYLHDAIVAKERTQLEAEFKITAAQTRQDRSFAASGKMRSVEFFVGDRVLLFDEDARCKMDPRFKGPYRVVGKLSSTSYRLQGHDGRYVERVNLRRLIPFLEKRGDSVVSVERASPQVIEIPVMQLREAVRTAVEQAGAPIAPAEVLEAPVVQNPVAVQVPVQVQVPQVAPQQRLTLSALCDREGQSKQGIAAALLSEWTKRHNKTAGIPGVKTMPVQKLLETLWPVMAGGTRGDLVEIASLVLRTMNQMLIVIWNWLRGSMIMLRLLCKFSKGRYVMIYGCSFIDTLWMLHSCSWFCGNHL